MKKAVFLDRDGVINVDKNYVHRVEDFELNQGIIELLQYLISKGFLLIIVTNQSGIGRGYFSEDDYLTFTEHFINVFKSHKISFDEIYFCPCPPSINCNFRKPNPGMILKGIKKYNINVSKSWMIGDKNSDIEAAERAGISNTIKVSSNHSPGSEKYSVKNLLEIKKIIK